jgi:hypothetical protein
MLAVAGFDLEERLELDTVAPRDRVRTLASLGVRAGDVLRIEREGATLRFEVAAPRRGTRRPSPIDRRRLRAAVRETPGMRRVTP